MPKYRKKPVEIEAVCFNGNNTDEIINFCNKAEECAIAYSSDPADIGRVKKWIIIKTLEGNMKADEGDFIIKGVNGEFYPCKPDIFEKTYDSVTE